MRGAGGQQLIQSEMMMASCLNIEKLHLTISDRLQLRDVNSAQFWIKLVKWLQSEKEMSHSDNNFMVVKELHRNLLESIKSRILEQKYEGEREMCYKDSRLEMLS